jgi:hypothetical protein
MRIKHFLIDTITNQINTTIWNSHKNWHSYYSMT